VQRDKDDLVGIDDRDLPPRRYPARPADGTGERRQDGQAARPHESEQDELTSRR
jgi:hypothetical protein